MDVLDVVTQEHSAILDLANRIQAAPLEERPELFDDLYDKLMIHSEAEQKVIYPYLAEHAGTMELAELVKEESHLTKYQLSLLKRTSVGNETWNAKFHVLHRLISLNMSEEEDNFNKLIRDSLTQREIDRLTDSYNRTRDKLAEKYA